MPDMYTYITKNENGYPIVVDVQYWGFSCVPWFLNMAPKFAT